MEYRDRDGNTYERALKDSLWGAEREVGVNVMASPAQFFKLNKMAVAKGFKLGVTVAFVGLTVVTICVFVLAFVLAGSTIGGGEEPLERRPNTGTLRIVETAELDAALAACVARNTRGVNGELLC